MAFFSSLNIAASGLTAQRMRLDVVAENITNIDTTRTESGDPYRRKMVVFQAGVTTGSSFRDALFARMNGTTQPGVQVVEIVEDETPFKQVYDPSHPDADEDGYVSMPNVDLLKETSDSMAAQRAYQANVTVLNALKLVAQAGLDIGR